MKVLYTIHEGGILKPMEINVPGGDIFALYLPDGTIWDTMFGVDDIHKLSPEEFSLLYRDQEGTK